MSRIRSLTMRGGLWGWLWSVTTVAQTDPPAPWVLLFNGRDLTAWKIVAMTNPAPAVVEGGRNAIRLRNIRVMTEQPKGYTQPTKLPPRRLPAGPGNFDKAKPSPL